LLHLEGREVPARAREREEPRRVAAVVVGIVDVVVHRARGDPGDLGEVRVCERPLLLRGTGGGALTARAAGEIGGAERPGEEEVVEADWTTHDTSLRSPRGRWARATRAPAATAASGSRPLP